MTSKLTQSTISRVPLVFSFYSVSFPSCPLCFSSDDRLYEQQTPCNKLWLGFSAAPGGRYTIYKRLYPAVVSSAAIAVVAAAVATSLLLDLGIPGGGLKPAPLTARRKQP